MNKALLDYDLHLHSGWSYDTNSELKDYFTRARELGIRCVGMTDHNNWDASSEALEYADDFTDVRYISGAELYIRTETLPAMCLHLLCFNIPFDLTDELKSVQRIYRKWTQSGGEALVNAFSEILGIDISTARRMAKSCRMPRMLDVQGLTPALTPGIETALLKEGLRSDREIADEITEKMWNEIPPVPLASKVIPLLKTSGVLTVLPHPHYLDNFEQLEDLTAELSLEGIECAHPKVPGELAKKLEEYCIERDLFKTAGSDSHTPEGLGNHKGKSEWLDEFLERITV